MILTIAIPTFNRATLLDETLQSIVVQKRFQNTNDVEIVISDNCSNDNTFEVVSKYIHEFGNKILYFRNNENIRDKNFETVLSRGNGLFLKLNNDTLKHTSNSLNIILDVIEANMETKNILFFLNQSLDKKSSSICKNLDEFILRVDYYGTWIGSFGIWKEDFDSIIDFSRYSHLQLIQTDVLYRLIGGGKTAFVNNELLFYSQDLRSKSKGGYDLITVFLDNHTFILREYLKEGNLKEATYKKFLKTLLIRFICTFLVLNYVYPNIYKFTNKSTFSRIFKFYCRYPILLFYFYIRVCLYLIYKLFMKLVKFMY